MARTYTRAPRNASFFAIAFIASPPVSAYSAFVIGGAGLLRSAARRRYSFAITRSAVAAASFDAPFAWFRQMRARSTRSSYELTRTPLWSHTTPIGA